MIALSNGNISLGNLPLFDNKNNPKGENSDNKRKELRKKFQLIIEVSCLNLI